MDKFYKEPYKNKKHIFKSKPHQLRRKRIWMGTLNEHQSFEILDANITTQTLIHEKQSQELSYLENEILKHLCINQNQAVGIKDILYNLWNDDSYYNRNSLHVFIY
ncbi:hypothetical protein HMPREF9455_03037 [Dysgonomonas gadei ATCC BAA-286]|uniref:OmpR/PhoB-type domain-containing protein n=1 Tax=Dysgonomonas gadei ATCC BAA-286 TaxID=742766 RepID=F5J120_9BACT|nr:hypothetical protein HMPREF9455_03037 [Dysgonomonas gadei ATCC BAA-286]